MAGIFGIAQTSEVELVAATTRTVLQITAGTDQRVKVLGWGVFFDGTNTAAEPVQVRVLRQTTTGTGMVGFSAVKLAPVTESLRISCRHTATAEPTAGDVMDMIECHPQQGYEVKFPMGQEIIIPGSGNLGIECTAPAGVFVRAKFFFEE